MELQADKADKKRTLSVTPQKVFLSSYEAVWKAALTVLKYSITDQNQETGHIETDYVKAADGGWLRPDLTKAPSAGIRYKILLSFVRIKTDSGKNGVKVTIDKRIEKIKDFFSDPENVDTDGLEEKAIFYRMERELLIEEAIKRLNNDPIPEI
ncbi:MAG: hypothetical protein HUU56_15690 [Bdellovibrionaceae bacterium]|nr:hypothetical protein [Pseudobdellovibrionaceae bacterium]